MSARSDYRFDRSSLVWCCGIVDRCYSQETSHAAHVEPSWGCRTGRSGRRCPAARPGGPERQRLARCGTLDKPYRRRMGPLCPVAGPSGCRTSGREMQSAPCVGSCHLREGAGREDLYSAGGPEIAHGGSYFGCLSGGTGMRTRGSSPGGSSSNQRPPSSLPLTPTEYNR